MVTIRLIANQIHHHKHLNPHQKHSYQAGNEVSFLLSNRIVVRRQKKNKVSLLFLQTPCKTERFVSEVTNSNAQPKRMYSLASHSSIDILSSASKSLLSTLKFSVLPSYSLFRCFITVSPIAQLIKTYLLMSKGFPIRLASQQHLNPINFIWSS